MGHVHHPVPSRPVHDLNLNLDRTREQGYDISLLAMGCCISSPTNPKTETHREIRRIRKSQISPPVILGISPSVSLTSKYSNDDERYYAPTPHRHPNIPPSNSPALGYQNTATPTRLAPTLSIQPPTPQKDEYGNTEVEAEFNFRIGNPSDIKRQQDEELAEEISLVGIRIGKLIHAIRAYSFHSAQTRTQTLGDLKGVIAALPRLPGGLVVRRVLEKVEREMGGLFEEKRRVFGMVRGAAVGCSGCESGRGELNGMDERDNRDGKAGSEGLWEAFKGLEDREKRNMARMLSKTCVLMRIFDMLSSLRAASEKLLALDSAVSLRLRREFEGVLGELKGFEGGGGGDRGGDGAMKGLEERVGGSASMQWRVLGIVQEKRREELERRMEGVKRGRGGVSVALLGVVEGLAEGGD
ncbi:hypothetical protein BKA61DRAFT_570946 [Leptodontidium sp. MPI-SDFR-AT-0119]|nr:hypothetical protein BKA61DRAFT_570946 [Leptodontidium sp. MPI-SDFR-AT-0119]